jgi:protein-disulfide isomerase
VKSAALAALALGLLAPQMVGAAPRTVGWNMAAEKNADGSHLVGNSKAKVRLTVYSNYTCTDCAKFAVESEGPLRIGMISSGQVALELRPVVKNPVDLVMAMLAECGDEARYFVRHTGFLRRQASWIKPMTTASASQQQRWRYGTLAQRHRAIANDLKLYDLMETMGADRGKTDRCLTDAAMAQRITMASDAALAAGVTQTPAFAINGALQPGVTTWAKLSPLINKSLTK